MAQRVWLGFNGNTLFLGTMTRDAGAMTPTSVWVKVQKTTGFSFTLFDVSQPLTAVYKGEKKEAPSSGPLSEAKYQELTTTLGLDRALTCNVG